MVSISFSLLLVFVANFFIEPTACGLPAYLQNRELDDITSLRYEFPSIIGKINAIVNQLYCPKGWKYLGGSCHYLSKITSTSTQANHTCNQLHSNRSNLMQIRNTIELFYAAHVLTKNNLSALMIEIDPNFLTGKRLAEILIDDQQRMKEKFRQEHVRYYKLKQQILDELNSADLRVSRRSKNIKQSVKNQNNASDNFQQIEEIQRICDQIDWNVSNNDSTIYILTISFVSNETVCSFNNVEPDLKYKHVCEYVLDYCFANTNCGKHGHCRNTLSGFKCSCSFLYDGHRCEKISKQGKQIIVCAILILILNGLSIKLIRWTLYVTIRRCISFRKQYRKKRKPNKNNIEVRSQELIRIKKTGGNRKAETQQVTDQNPPIIIQKSTKFSLSRNNDPGRNPHKRNLIRSFWVGGLSVLILSSLFSITTIAHLKSFKYDIVNETKFDSLINETVQLLAKCSIISNYRIGNLLFFPFALALIFLLSWSIKRERRCLNRCDGRPGLISPIEPFRTGNRITTATVFGILTFNTLKILEELLYNADYSLNHDIITVFFEGIALVFFIGVRYYPVLASLQLRNIVARCLVCLYLFADIICTIIRERSCMSFLPLSTYHTTLEEATLRLRLGTWFIIYGLIKNTPHFILLSYITAELCVRFAYDSLYVPIKKKQSIWSPPETQPDDSAFAKYYVRKLFRRNLRAGQPAYSTDVNIDSMQDYENEAELQRNAKPSRVKQFFDSIYHWDDGFRFTTIATCTYTVAIIVLYYLACTLVFLYILRTPDYISFIKYYFETTLNIEFHGFFSLRSTVITSAVITVVIFVCHLLFGMRNYQKHKLQLFKGIYEDVPSAVNFKLNFIASKSVRYFGLLIGYMACGFVICFHLIFFILCAIRILSLQIIYVEWFLAITVPVLVVYLLIMISVSLAEILLLSHHMKENLRVRNGKIYAIFVYFTFFVDCFLGIASCIIRLIKAIVLNVISMARLDYSLHGRLFEKFDFGYAAYVSYLHMEVAYTNPIMLAFCYSAYDGILKRRRKYCSNDDEYPSAPVELNDEEIIIGQKLKVIKKISSKTSHRGEQGLLSEKTKVNERGIVPSIEREQNLVDTDDDDDENFSIEEAKSPSPSTISEKHSQNFKQQVDIQNEEEAPQAKQKSRSNMPTAYSTISHLLQSEKIRELTIIIKQKRARFRWFLAYTMIHNYRLFDLRKQKQDRLVRLRFVRNSLIDQQQEDAAAGYFQHQL